MDRLSDEDIELFRLMQLINDEMTVGSIVECILPVQIKQYKITWPVGTLFKIVEYLPHYEAHRLRFIPDESHEHKKDQIYVFATPTKYMSKKYKKVITMQDIKKQ
jgi:hypothetical protein